ncbi:MAG: methyl-accepting chemotaxis protein [Polyangiaceae bacterium]|jgi:methyl-accepting chemotaxis protein|nr:methyl-accepting chemotaxis protein [Polyangiaceae bacterium]
MTRRRRKLLGILGGDPQGTLSSPSPEIETKLWSSQQGATEGATRVTEAAAHIFSLTVRQKATLDAIEENALATQARARDIGDSIDRVSLMLEQLRLIALNVGLEGARLTEPAGRALATVADEVRLQGERGQEAIHDLRAAVDESQPAVRHLLERVGLLRAAHAECAAQLERIQASAQQVTDQVNEIGSCARKLSNTDPETARALAQAADHAQGLFGALSAVGAEARRDIVRSALGPTLQPLLRILSELTPSQKSDKDPP